MNIKSANDDLLARMYQNKLLKHIVHLLIDNMGITVVYYPKNEIYKSIKELVKMHSPIELNQMLNNNNLTINTITKTFIFNNIMFPIDKSKHVKKIKVQDEDVEVVQSLGYNVGWKELFNQEFEKRGLEMRFVQDDFFSPRVAVTLPQNISLDGKTVTFNKDLLDSIRYADSSFLSSFEPKMVLKNEKDTPTDDQVSLILSKIYFNYGGFVYKEITKKAQEYANAKISPPGYKYMSDNACIYNAWLEFLYEQKKKEPKS